ncbi:hypothetical protein KJ966_31230 [bacterium]|nr:hypothetical protein [bacterium]
MSILSFVIRRKGGDVLILSLHRGFRIFFLGLAAYLGFALVFDSGSTGSNTGPIVFIILSVLSGCYYEAWIFDKSKQIVQKHHGLLLLFSRKTIPLDALDSIGIERFVRGRIGNTPISEDGFKKNSFAKKETCKLYINLKNGERLDIEILNNRYSEGLKKKAETLAAFCEKPLALDN